MSLRVAKMQTRDLSFPRVSGDEPAAGALVTIQR